MLLVAFGSVRVGCLRSGCFLPCGVAKCLPLQSVDPVTLGPRFMVVSSGERS